MASAEEAVFLRFPRRAAAYRPASERVKDYREVTLLRSPELSQEQSRRCLDCGVPFCHWACPIGNYVPTWNRWLAKGEWERAFEALHATNNIPEITSRICPAPCESACVLAMTGEAVTIREDELAVIERAFAQGLVQPRPPRRRSGKSVAVIGSGPAGLCCAAQLNQAGHTVVVFERDDRLGGLLRYGIPDFKLEKWVLDRRVEIWKQEGVQFETGIDVGRQVPVGSLQRRFDAMCLTGGCRTPRDLPVPGRELAGIHVALEYLVQANRLVAGEAIPDASRIDARDKRVVVIGGGDTGADCVGTAHRQGARAVIQLEVLPPPPELQDPRHYWPQYPPVLRASTSHEEGPTRREWSVLTKAFLGHQGRVVGMSCARVEAAAPGAPLREIPGSAFELDADLVLLAVGFTSPESAGLLSELGAQRDARGNVATDEQQMTSIPGIFCAGDMRRGQSLVAWAVTEGRRAAHCIDRFLTGHSQLPWL